jgi:hypothetical protein
MYGDFRQQWRFLGNHPESQGAEHMGVLRLSWGIKKKEN